MPRGIPSKSSGLSLDANTGCEVSDNSIKQEISDTISIRNITKEDNDDGRNCLCAIDSQRSGSQPADNVNDEVAKQEVEITEKPPYHDGEQASTAFNWDEEITAAEAEVDRLRMVRLPSSELGRIMLEDQLIHIFHTDVVRNAKTFVVYDGLDVLACFTNNKMENAVWNLAALYIGSKLKWSHPLDHDLKMSFSSFDVKGNVFSIKLSPPSIGATMNQEGSGPQ